MECETITFEVEDHVATITLDRPESLNSFDDRMAKEMTWAWETVRDTDDIHAVVLQANGERAFCTGVDLRSDVSWFVKANPWNSFDPGVMLSPKFHHKVWKPVVCAVHGLCAGGGQYFLNEADIIICSDDAEFFDPHANGGIVSALEPIGMLARGVPAGDVLRWALMGTEERITAATGTADRPGHRGGAPSRSPGPGARRRRSHRGPQPDGHPGHGAGHLGVDGHDPVGGAGERSVVHPDRQRGQRRPHASRQAGADVPLRWRIRPRKRPPACR